MRSPDGRLFDSETGATSAPEQVRQGITALIQLLQTPAVWTAMVAFRTDFEASCEQIAILSAYKYLHDRFHELEDLTKAVNNSRKLLASDPMAWDVVMGYEPDMQEIIGRLLTVARGPIVADEGALWVRQLGRVCQDLRAAVEALDETLLGKTFALLNRVIDNEPTRIDVRLVEAARALRLAKLVEAIARVRKSLAQPGLDLAAVRHVVTAVDALSGLRNRLAALVRQHHRWQDIGDQMHRIEGNLGQDTAELESSWPDIELVARELYGNNPAEWALALNEIGVEVARALAEGAYAKAKMHFWRYRSKAGRRFSEVDTDLLNLCQDLETIGESLSQLIEALQDEP
jgi:hypothetical protein